MEYSTKLTENFRYGEFWCNGVEPPERYQDNIQNLATELQKLRAVLNRPIRVTSGYRTPEHNKTIGGAKYSQHLYGKAADIKVSRMHSKRVPLYVARYTNIMGIGVSYKIDSITHCDIRDKFTNWYY